MYNFFTINIQLRGSSLSKEDYHKFLKVTNSSPDASDGRDHQQLMFLHDWKVRTPPPPPPPQQQKRLQLINHFSSIAGKLIHIEPENFQWQHTAFFLRLFVSRDLYLFCFLK